MSSNTQLATALPVSSLTVAVVSSALFGGVTGTFFDDSDTVGGQLISGDSLASIDVNHPIQKITVRYGSIIDGISITYNLSGDQDPVTKEHGVNHTCKDGTLKSETFELNADEEIIAVTGRSGETTMYGPRTTNLSFVIWNRAEGKVNVRGPFGGSQGQPFRVTANGNFIAFSGYAQDQQKSVYQNDRSGGLYGLKFIEVDYRKV